METYSRKLSAEEAREGCVLVLKDRLGFFPPVGKSFRLQCGVRTVRSRVESRACECRGPDKPHEHYFIRLRGLAAKSIVTFRRESEKPPVYSLAIANAR